MPKLSDAQRNNAFGHLEAGETQQAVARHLGVSRQTMASLWTRYNDTQNASVSPRSGRPRITTSAQDRYIRM